MSQRHIEKLIGRLLTDEELRSAFIRRPADTLATLSAEGWEISPLEREVLLGEDPTMWRDLARRIPSRLQRCNLRAR
jgi:hypothetical protein